MPNRAPTQTSGRKSYMNRRERERQQALEKIQEQIASGKLVIRKMTAEELERYGPPKKLGRNANRLLRSKALGSFYKEHFVEDGEELSEEFENKRRPPRSRALRTEGA
jgi:hypothetical protein